MSVCRSPALQLMTGIAVNISWPRGKDPLGSSMWYGMYPTQPFRCASSTDGQESMWLGCIVCDDVAVDIISYACVPTLSVHEIVYLLVHVYRVCNAHPCVISRATLGGDRSKWRAGCARREGAGPGGSLGRESSRELVVPSSARGLPSSVTALSRNSSAAPASSRCGLPESLCTRYLPVSCSLAMAREALLSVRRSYRMLMTSSHPRAHADIHVHVYASVGDICVDTCT